MACLWNLEDDYYIVSNQPCYYFNGMDITISTKKLMVVSENYITTKDSLISFNFIEQDNGVYTDCCIIPNYYAIFKTELTAKAYMIEIIDNFKNILELAKPTI